MKRGDHLVTPRVGYKHHGIYLGGNQVIHYSGFSEFGKGGPIVKVSLRDFAQGQKVQVKQHPYAKFDSEERIRRAKSRLGEESYNLVLNNCEHFVNWCIYDASESSQVNIAAGSLSGLVVRKSVAPVLVKGAVVGLMKAGVVSGGGVLAASTVVPLALTAVSVAGILGGAKIVKNLARRKNIDFES